MRDGGTSRIRTCIQTSPRARTTRAPHLVPVSVWRLKRGARDPATHLEVRDVLGAGWARVGERGVAGAARFVWAKWFGVSHSIPDWDIAAMLERALSALLDTVRGSASPRRSRRARKAREMQSWSGAWLLMARRASVCVEARTLQCKAHMSSATKLRRHRRNCTLRVRASMCRTAPGGRSLRVMGCGARSPAKMEVAALRSHFCRSITSSLGRRWRVERGQSSDSVCGTQRLARRARLWSGSRESAAGASKSSCERDTHSPVMLASRAKVDPAATNEGR